MESTVEKLYNSLRATVPELNAAILVGTAGEFEVHKAPDFDFDAESFAAEYAALFRIARRTAEDTDMGEAFEQILISDKALLIARRINSDDVVLFVCGADQHLGRLRYEIRRFVENFALCVA